MARRRHIPTRASTGVALLEACLAILALAAGLLALAHIQLGLQTFAEAARERAQAVMLAQATLERQRRYTVLEPAAALTAYADVRSFSQQAELSPGAARPAVVRLDITDLPGLHHKAASVTVAWHDRHGAVQSVQLHTVLAAVPP
jgi:hypothetical protein